MIEWVLIGFALVGAGYLVAESNVNARGGDGEAPERRRGKGEAKSSRPSISPVVGTIIMVAITVVLAAVLYVVVAGVAEP